MTFLQIKPLIRKAHNGRSFHFIARGRDFLPLG
jgi:hypothetical protein